MTDATRDAKPANGATRAAEAVKPDAARPLAKKFYEIATVEEADGVFAVLLDGRRLRSPRKRPFTLPRRALAEAVAREWSEQIVTIDPAKMPLTTLAFTAVDAVAGEEAAVAAEIVKYAASDLLCYRAEAPVELVKIQAQHWDPLLRWAEEELGARFHACAGLMPIPQPKEAADAVASAISGLPALQLAGLHVLTTLTGSAVLALAVQRRHLSLEAAWAAAHVDEDWQIARWGEDADAKKRHNIRLREARAAAIVLAA
jgi:chaperone required for assembly of F1-ATPase